MNLKILRYPHKVLRTKTDEVEKFTQSLQEISEEMIDEMIRNGGVGLAAPQVGLNLRMFVSNQIEPYVFINPQWRPSPSGFPYLIIEGCLSFPGWIIPVERYDAILIEYDKLDGERVKGRLKKFQAQIFQHETDHLDGKLIVDHLTKAQQKTINNAFRR